jgi:hypothetical protein
MATQQPSAVRFFAVDHPAVAGTVRARLEQRRKDLLEEMMVSSDWGDFCKRLGRVEGVMQCINLCSDVEKELQERNS